MVFAMAVVATVVNVWKMNGVAYAELVVPNPLGGAAVTFQVQTPAVDAQGNPLSPAQIQANLSTAARAAYNAQFGTPAALTSPGTISF